VSTNANHKFKFIEIKIISPEVAAEVRDLWLKSKVMNVQTINERINEISVIVRDEADKLVGVSTVKKSRIKLFDNNYFFEFRCFIDKQSRQPALDTQLVIKTKEFLQRIRNEDPIPAIGLLMVVENEILKQWTRTVWAGADFYFVGYTSKDHHIRVSYFDDVFI
jgi:hypothetical protein